jgi:hypothetical protein
MGRPAMEHLVQGNLQLAGGSLLRIEEGRGMMVYVWRGSVWITQHGDERDRHLAAGGWFRIDSGGLTLVSTLGRTVLSLTSPREHGFAQRIDVVRAGTDTTEPLYVAPGFFARLRARWAGRLAPQARAGRPSASGAAL